MPKKSSEAFCAKGCGKTWPRDPVLEVKCPDCFAAVGVRCVNPSGHRKWGSTGNDFHAARDLAADKAGKYGPCPRGCCGLERTAAGAQSVLPGAERKPAALARRLAAAPLKPAADQKPCDVGLFSDVAAQSDLIDQLRSTQS